ncbi:hypothetical protein B0H10DRAFT_2234357 [Mycena sp. CBHHK59/15]|nr:hypothetical protein B0H10DRAFT_2234357 [Mycena sp. CBHHK59/15]
MREPITTLELTGGFGLREREVHEFVASFPMLEMLKLKTSLSGTRRDAAVQPPDAAWKAPTTLWLLDLSDAVATEPFFTWFRGSDIAISTLKLHVSHDNNECAPYIASLGRSLAYLSLSCDDSPRYDRPFKFAQDDLLKRNTGLKDLSIRSNLAQILPVHAAGHAETVMSGPI